MGIMPEEFSEVAEISVDKELRAGVWAVYEKYRRPCGSGGTRYVEAPSHIGLHEKNERWEYRPLVKYPDLFLRFARLSDDGGLDDGFNTEKNAKVALGWAQDYGLLGLTPAKERVAWWGETRGGVEDTVERFAFEAWAANYTLRLYEAATAPGGTDVETIASSISSRHRRRFTGTPGDARDWALEQVVRNVQDRVARHAYPQLYEGADGSFVQGWDFSNLLGAMWLQMFWFLIYGNERLCQNPECNRVIAFEQPDQPYEGLSRNNRSGGYATREDKRFCSGRCRNRYNYLTGTKPRRQAARASQTDTF